MRRINFFGICIFMFLLVTNLTFATMYTGSLSPDSIDVCGNYSDTFSLTASQIWNVGSVNYTDVTAYLINPDDDVFTFTSLQGIDLGNISSGDESSVSPLVWDLECDNSQNFGNYTFYVYYTNQTDTIGNSSEVISNNTVSIVNVQKDLNMDLDIITPKDIVYTTQPNLSVLTDKNVSCRFDKDDVDFSNMSDNMTGDFNHYASFGNILDGTHNYYLECRNDEYEKRTTFSFKLDTTAPTIVDYNPKESISTSYTELNVETNEDAICKYLTSKNQGFDDMNSFTTSNNVVHKVNLVGLEDWTYTYYILCEDLYENRMDEFYELSFDVDTGPVVSIDIDGNEPLTTGTYDVKLTSNEELIPTPKLSLTLGSSNIDVSLIGQAKNWEGKLRINSENIDNEIGVFTFHGTDVNGNGGNVINDGKTILVDTQIPGIVTNLISRQEDDKVKLSWSQVDEDIDYYQIYRETNPRFDPNEVFDTTSSNYYYDNYVDSKTYYYAIRAVDKADNIGDFSPVSKVSVVKTQEENEDENEVLIVDNLLNVTKDRIDEDLIEFKELVSEYSSYKEYLNSQFSDMIEALDLLSINKDIDSQITLIEEVIDKIKNINRSSDNNARKILDDLEDQVEETKRKVIKDIIIMEEENYLVSVDDTSKNKLLDSYAKINRLGGINELNLENLNKTTHNLTITKFYTKSYDDKVDYYTLVSDSSNSENQVIIGFLDKIDDINEVISDDIKSKYSTSNTLVMENNYIFLINANVNGLDEINYLEIPEDLLEKETEVTDDENDSSNFFTGSVIKKITSYEWDWGLIIGLFVIFGLLSYYFLVLGKNNDVSFQDMSVSGNSNSKINTKMPRNQNKAIKQSNNYKGNRNYNNYNNSYDNNYDFSNDGNFNNSSNSAMDSINKLVGLLDKFVDKNPNYSNKNLNGNYSEDVKDYLDDYFSSESPNVLDKDGKHYSKSKKTDYNDDTKKYHPHEIKKAVNNIDELAFLNEEIKEIISNNFGDEKFVRTLIKKLKPEIEKDIVIDIKNKLNVNKTENHLINEAIKPKLINNNKEFIILNYKLKDLKELYLFVKFLDKDDFRYFINSRVYFDKWLDAIGQTKLKPILYEINDKKEFVKILELWLK